MGASVLPVPKLVKESSTRSIKLMPPRCCQGHQGSSWTWKLVGYNHNQSWLAWHVFARRCLLKLLHSCQPGFRSKSSSLLSFPHLNPECHTTGNKNLIQNKNSKTKNKQKRKQQTYKTKPKSMKQQKRFLGSIPTPVTTPDFQSWLFQNTFPLSWEVTTRALWCPSRLP